MTEADARAALEQSVAELSPALRDHVLRVVEEARRLARRHGIDEERAEMAALGHDLARAESRGDLLRQADAAGLDVSEIERAEPILLHGRLSAGLMVERHGIKDEEVVAAVRYHTTGREGMSALERLLFVADKIEADKARRRPALAEARRMAEENIDDAMLHLLDAQVSRALERGWPLHPDTVAARNELLAQRGGRT